MLRSLWLLLAFALAVGGCAPGGNPIRLRDSGEDPIPADDGGTVTRPDTGPPPPARDAGPPRPGDRDADGLPDDDELARGTDPDNEDTDGDGYSDGVEVLAGTDPNDSSSFIPPTDFYVVLEYEEPALLRELEFTARLGRGDVYFLVDTTGSMASAINNVRDSLMDEIVPAVSGAIADLVMGVGDFRDFPVDPYGNSGDWDYRVRQPMTADVAAVQSALGTLSAGGGGDGPEAQIEGLFRSVGDACAGGTGFGSACFREGSHPIVVVVTDAETHNDRGGANPYSGVAAHSYAETTAAYNANGVKIVGAAVNPIPPGFPFPTPSPATDHLEQFAADTGSRSATGGLTVYDAPQGEVDTAVVDGIVDLVGAETQDVTSRTLDDESDAVDARDFIKAVTPLRASRATSFDETTFYGVAGGTTITFQVTFENDFLPHASHVQIFRAYIEVYDTSSSIVLDRRNVYIVVPAVGGVLI